MKIQHAQLGKRKGVLFEAEDVNDPDWEKIVKIMYENNITVLYGNDNYMCFEWTEEWEEE